MPGPDFEPYHSWGQDHEQHYIQVEGPGTITDGGPTRPNRQGAATANTDKQVTVQCTTHVDSDKIPTTDYVNPTEHVVKIAGATKETRIVIAASLRNQALPPVDRRHPGNERPIITN